MLVKIMCKDDVHKFQACIEPAQKCKMWHLFSDIALGSTSIDFIYIYIYALYTKFMINIMICDLVSF